MSEKLTKADLEKIQKEIDERKTVLRPQILEDVKVARAQGDLSENFEYYAARKANRENNSRIDYLERMVKNAEIVEEAEKGITLNNLVKIKFVKDDIAEDLWEIEQYKIVTSIRADSTKKRISIESPLGKALIGHEINDVVKVQLDNGSSYNVKIVEVDIDLSDDDIKSF